MWTPTQLEHIIAVGTMAAHHGSYTHLCADTLGNICLMHQPFGDVLYTWEA